MLLSCIFRRPYWEPSIPIKSLVVGLLVHSSSWTLSMLKSFSGCTRPIWPAFLGPAALSPSSSGTSGGPQWIQAPIPMSHHVTYASAGKHPIRPMAARHSQICHWVSPVTEQSLPLSTRSLSQSISLPFSSFHQPKKLLTSMASMALDIVSEQGPQFTSQMWKSFCRALWTSTSLSSGFHLQTNSQTAQANQDLEAALHCITTSNTSTWSTHLAWAEYVHKSLISSAISMSPLKATLG